MDLATAALVKQRRQPAERAQDLAGLARRLACLFGGGTVLLPPVRLADRQLIIGAGDLLLIGGESLDRQVRLAAENAAPSDQLARVRLPGCQASLSFRRCPVDLRLLPAATRLFALDPRLPAVKPLRAHDQQFAGAFDVLKRALIRVRGGIAGPARALIEFTLGLVEFPLALVSPALAFVSPALALISLALTLVGDYLPLVGKPFTRISLALARVGPALALVSLPLTLVNGTFARNQGFAGSHLYLGRSYLSVHNHTMRPSGSFGS